MTAAVEASRGGQAGDRFRLSRSSGQLHGRPPAPMRRRKGRIVAGLVAVVLGAWIFAALYMSAGERTNVVALARTVQRDDQIDRADLKVVRIGTAGENVQTVPASELDDLVGHTATADMRAGTLLAPGQIRAEEERVVEETEAVVGVLMPAGTFPSEMQRGDDAVMVLRPKEGSEGDVEEIEGWVYRADGEPLTSGDQPMEVVVSRLASGALSAAAADGRVTIVMLDG